MARHASVKTLTRNVSMRKMRCVPVGGDGERERGGGGGDTRKKREREKVRNPKNIGDRPD